MSEVAQRDAKGRFAKGWAGGPGRLPVAQEKKYLTTLQDAVEMDEWIEICETAVLQAMDGDWRARDWLSKYLLPPVQVLRARIEEEYDPDTDKKITTLSQILMQVHGISEE